MQVFLHYSLQNQHGDVLLSTRAEHGGSGRPQPFVLGRGRRMLRGMELGVMGACRQGWRERAAAQPKRHASKVAAGLIGWCRRDAPPSLCCAATPTAEMARGERAMLDIQPSYAFQHKDSGLAAPQGLRPEMAVAVDVTVGGWVDAVEQQGCSHVQDGLNVAPLAHSPPFLSPCKQLTHWYQSAGVKCVGESGDAFLRTLQPGQGWECPRPPFEVSLHAAARVASTSGRQQEGEPYFSTAGAEPLTCSLGAGSLPPGERRAWEVGGWVAGCMCMPGCMWL